MRKAFKFLKSYLYYFFIPILGGVVFGFTAICKVSFHFDELAKLETWITSFMLTYLAFSITFLFLNIFPRMRKHQCINASISFTFSTIIGMVSYSFLKMSNKDKILQFGMYFIIGLLLCGGGFIVAFLSGRKHQFNKECNMSDKFIEKFKEMPERERHALLGAMVAKLEYEKELQFLFKISDEEIFEWTTSQAYYAEQEIEKNSKHKK